MGRNMGRVQGECGGSGEEGGEWVDREKEGVKGEWDETWEGCRGNVEGAGGGGGVSREGSGWVGRKRE